MKADDMRLDGNAIGGLLFELFGSDLTEARSVCASCGAEGYVATLDVYMQAPGVVGRCRSCDAVMLSIVRSETRTWLDLSGTRSIEIPMGQALE
jgi:Family of unknown function (DUF6510)